MLTYEQALQQSRPNSAAAGEMLVLLQLFLGEGECLFRYQGRHRNLNPFLAGPFLACTLAWLLVSASQRSPCDAPSFSPLRFSEAGSASIGRVPEHSPHRRSFPSLVAAAGRDLPLVELTRDGANAASWS